jgi:small conductance mechanosensitive channel
MAQRPATRTRARLTSAALALSLLGLGPSSMAQTAQRHAAVAEPEPPPAAAPPPAADPAPAAAPVEAASKPSPARQLLATVQTARSEVDGLRRAALPSNAAEREVARGALIESSASYRQELVEAALAVAEAPGPAGAADEQRELTAVLGSELENETPRIAAEIAESLQLTIRLTDETNGATPETRAGIAQRRNRAMGWYTQLFGQFRDNLRARTRLGQDTKADRTRFITLLREASLLTNTALKRAESTVSELTPSPGAPLAPAAQAHLDALREHRDLLAAALRRFIDYMSEQGLDTVQLRQDLISTTGEMSHDILDPRVLEGLFGEWKTKTLRWASERAPEVAFGLLSFAVVLGLFGVLARIGRGLVRRAFARSKGTVSGLAGDFVVTSTGRLLWVLGFVIAAAQLGIEVAPLIAGLGIAGFVVGFALQDTLSNFAAGMMILIYRPFDIGDMIEAGGVEGNVKAMTLVYTSVLTPDNQMLIVPNSKIWGGVIRNVTHQDKRRIDLQFAVSYRDDLARAEALFGAALRDNPRVLEEPAPSVRLHELAESCARFVVRPWVQTADYWETYWELTRDVKRRFDAEGFSFPFPQRDLHIYDERRLDRVARDSEVAPAQSGLR